MKTICNSCKHFGEVAWSRKSFGCKLANVNWGKGDGYGPWYKSAVCKHDPGQTKLEDKFEPSEESDRVLLLTRIEATAARAEKAERLVEQLERKIVEVAKS